MIKKYFYQVKTILDNMKDDHVSESSAECAYYVILSFIPFTILVITLIQFTNIESSQLFEIISRIIPDNMKDLFLGIVREVYSKSIGTVSISLIVTLYSASKGLFALTKELHLIYNYTDNKKKSWLYLKIISIMQTIIFILTLVLCLFAMVFGKTILVTVKENFGVFTNYTLNDVIITRTVFLIISFVLLLLMYKFLSRHKMSLKSQLKGSIISAICINIVSYIFSRYLEIFKGFSTTYGSLTTMILVMMWTYVCFYIIFLGAEINKYYNNNNCDK